MISAHQESAHVGMPGTDYPPGRVEALQEIKEKGGKGN